MLFGTKIKTAPDIWELVWHLQLGLSIIRSRPGYHSQGLMFSSWTKTFSGNISMRRRNSVTVKKWYKKIDDSWFCLSTRKKQDHCRNHRNTKHLALPANLSDCFCFINYSFIFLLVFPPSGKDLLRCSIIELSPFPESIQPKVSKPPFPWTLSKSPKQSTNSLNPNTLLLRHSTIPHDV